MDTEIFNNIRFIMPKHSFTYSFVEKSGYDIAEPYIGNSWIPRIAREVFFRLNLPGKRVWYNKKNANGKPICFLLESLITPDYVNWLHEKNPNSRIILLYENPVTAATDPNLFSDDICEKWSTDINDCKKYNMRLYNGGAYFKINQVVKKEPKYDVFYIGRDKGRMSQLQQLEKKFNDLGLTTYFYITAIRRISLRMNKNLKPIIPYDKVLDILGESRAILHLSDGCQKGITYRIEESLIHKIKLITDDKDIMQYDFYHPDNIFILGKDDYNSLPDFLNKPYVEVDSSFFNNCYFEDAVALMTES